MQKHIQNYITNSTPDDNPVTFNSSKHLLTFAMWHTANGKGIQTDNDLNQQIYMETSRRAPYQEGIMRSYHIEPIISDYNGLGKYMNRDSYAMIESNGKIVRWPLTMLYLKKETE